MGQIMCWSFVIVLVLLSFAHGMRYPTLLSSRIAPILGESALVDAETGQVFWQDTSLRFQNTVEHAYGSERATGIGRHLKCTTLSLLLWMEILKTLLNGLMRTKLYTAMTTKMTTCSLFLSYIVKILPTINRKVVAVILILYLIESYTCSTKSYLENALTSPYQIKEYMEHLRSQKPSVLWSVRCFHYEPHYWVGAKFWSNLKDWVSNGFQRSHNIQNPTHERGFTEKIPLMFTRVVETHRSTQAFDFFSWEDRTSAGIWKRADVSDPENFVHFTKMKLSKIVLLADSKTRKDYFTQQGEFVADKGRLDSHVEFSTSVHIPDFKPKLLAVRTPNRYLYNFYSIQMFWILTILGLSLPYRVWFGNRCDEVRIMVVKETSTRDDWISLRKKTIFGWKDETMETSFDSKMEEARLYN